MSPSIDANDDHLAYIYSFDQADEDVIRVFQLYASAEAAAAFLETESYERYLAAVEGLLSGPPELYAVTPEWSKNVGGPGCRPQVRRRRAGRRAGSAPIGRGSCRERVGQYG